MDQGLLTGAVYLIVLRKAFDSVDQNLLINELESYGLKNAELNWFKSQLSSEVFELVWLPMSIFFHTKNNVMSYDISSSPIYQYKKTVAIPLLDFLIIQMQDRFLTKIAMPALCFV